MPSHDTNRKAFYGCATAEPLLQLYTMLIAIELALKDRSGSFGGGHDLQKLATSLLSEPSGSNLQAVLTTFTQSLTKLRCTTVQNQGANVSAVQYPHVRYLRFKKDGFMDGSPEEDVQHALDTAREFAKELRRAGVQL